MLLQDWLKYEDTSEEDNKSGTCAEFIQYWICINVCVLELGLELLQADSPVTLPSSERTTEAKNQETIRSVEAGDKDEVRIATSSASHYANFDLK